MSAQYVERRLSDLRALKNRLSIINGGIETKDRTFDLNIRLRGSGEYTNIAIDKEVALAWMQEQKIKLENDIKKLSDAIDHCAELLGNGSSEAANF